MESLLSKQALIKSFKKQINKAVRPASNEL